MITVTNLTFLTSDKFIFVDNYIDGYGKIYEIWNCPLPTNELEDRNSSTIGFWKIKQLKK